MASDCSSRPLPRFEKFPSDLTHRMDAFYDEIFTQFDSNISVSGELGSAKKDQVYMVISGLDQVDFGNKNQLTCITSGVIGAGSVQTENLSQCISEQKIIS